MNNKKSKTYLLVGLGVIVVLLAIFFALSFANKQQNQKIMPVQSTSKKKRSSDEWADLSIRQIVGLSIVYSHLKYSDNENWEDVFDEAQDGELNVQRYNNYHFDSNRSVEASKSQRLYILNKKTALVITNADEATKSSIIMGDDEQEIGAVNLKAAYEYVKSQGQLGLWKDLCKNLDVGNEVTTQSDTNETSHDDNDDEDADSGNKYGLEKFTVPDQFIGKWYAVDKDGKVSVIKINAKDVNGHSLYKDNEKFTSSKEFSENDKLRQNIWFARMNGSTFAFGPAGINATGFEIKGNYAVVSQGELNPPKYYRSLAEAKQHPYKY